MGIFDEVEKIGGSLIGEQHAGALSAVTEYINSPQVGGISGLQKMFEEKGLGGIVGSWIGGGQNSADFGGSTEQRVAQRCVESGGLEVWARSRVSCSQ